MPGQVSSGSTAHHSRASTRTGRTRKGRLRSPRLATNDGCFRSAFFTAETVPSLTRTLSTHFFLRGPFPMKDCSTLPSSCPTNWKPLCTYNIPHPSGSSPVAKYNTKILILKHFGYLCAISTIYVWTELQGLLFMNGTNDTLYSIEFQNILARRKKAA